MGVRFHTRSRGDLSTISYRGCLARILQSAPTPALPRYAGREISTEEGPLAQLPRPAARPTILVVEDDPLIRMTVEVFLDGRGFTPITIDGPAAALALDARVLESVDAIVTDMVMPEMSGSELVRALQARRPDLRAIYMSAYPEDVLVAEGRLEAGQPTLLKPFSEDELVALVERVLGS